MPFAQAYSRCKSISRLTALRDAILALQPDDLGTGNEIHRKYEWLARVESRIRELSRCEVCDRAPCVCHAEPPDREPLTNHGLSEDQRLDDPRHS